MKKGSRGSLNSENCGSRTSLPLLIWALNVIQSQLDNLKPRTPLALSRCCERRQNLWHSQDLTSAHWKMNASILSESVEHIPEIFHRGCTAVDGDAMAVETGDFWLTDPDAHSKFPLASERDCAWPDARSEAKIDTTGRRSLIINALTRRCASISSNVLQLHGRLATVTIGLWSKL